MEAKTDEQVAVMQFYSVQIHNKKLSDKQTNKQTNSTCLHHDDTCFDPVGSGQTLVLVQERWREKPEPKAGLWTPPRPPADLMQPGLWWTCFSDRSAGGASYESDMGKFTFKAGS